MYPALSYAVAAYLGVVALVALAGIRAPALDPLARTAMRVGHGLAALVVALDLITLLQGHEVSSQVTHIGYAVATVGLPVVLLNRPAVGADEGEEGEEPPDAEPPHLAVVAVTAIAMVVLVVRLQQTW